MDSLIKLNSQTAGKDKIARLIQYASRAVWYYFQKRQFNPRTVGKLKSLEYTLSTFRKLLRLGKTLEVLYALKAIHSKDMMVKVTCTLSKISNALFLLADHIVWIGRSGLATVNTKKWVEMSNRYWLFSILLNLARDVYEILRILNEEHIKLCKNNKALTTDLSRQVLLLSKIFIYNRTDVFWDFIKNASDVWIPLTALGYTALKPGTIGFLGTVSSIAGIVALVNPKARLFLS